MTSVLHTFQMKAICVRGGCNLINMTRFTLPGPAQKIKPLPEGCKLNSRFKTALLWNRDDLILEFWCWFHHQKFENVILTDIPCFCYERIVMKICQCCHLGCYLVELQFLNDLIFLLSAPVPLHTLKLHVCSLCISISPLRTLGLYRARESCWH